MRRLTRTFAGSLLWLLPTVAPAQPDLREPKTLLEVSTAARAARLAGNASSWLEFGRKAVDLAPDHADLLVSVARASAANGKRADALSLLQRAAELGAGFDARRFPEFQNESSAEFLRVNATALANLAPLPRARLFATLGTDSPVEGIAYDPRSKRFFVGAENGAILQIDERGVSSTFFGPGSGLLEALGMKVDSRRGLLWVATTVFPGGSAPAKPKEGVSGIVAIRLSDGQIAHQAWLDERPKLHAFNDLEFGPDGTVFITDTLAGAVFAFRRLTGKLELVVEDPKLSYANGITAGSGGRIYIAHAEGLSALTPGSTRLDRLKVPPNTSVNSIDGLVYHDGNLIGIQNSPCMSRIVRIRLNPAGDQVTGTDVLNSRTPREYGLTTAVVIGGELFAVGGSPASDCAGRPLADAPKFQIVRLRL